MANKRIELEQCKYYVNLQEEYPSRKTVRHGVQITLITTILLVLALFVLGMLSGDLAVNPANVLEEPPEKPVEAPADGQVPQDVLDQMPTDGQTPMQLPEGMPMPTDGQTPMQLPEGVPPIPAPEDGGSPGGSRLTGPVICDIEPPATAGDGTLLAQAEPDGAQPETPTGAPPDAGQEITIPAPESSVPGQPEPAPPDGEAGDETQEKDEGPPQQTTGVGNLANLVDQVNGRGFQIYLLVLALGLMVVFYLAVRRVRLEGKHK